MNILAQELLGNKNSRSVETIKGLALASAEYQAWD
jgi:hypothetical protein